MTPLKIINRLISAFASSIIVLVIGGFLMLKPAAVIPGNVVSAHELDAMPTQQTAEPSRHNPINYAIALIPIAVIMLRRKQKNGIIL